MARSALYRSILPVFLLWAWTAVVWESAAGAAAEAPKAADPRLDQTLRLDLMRVPLSDLCAVMERRSGVAHRAGDPATGDLLANVVGTLTVAQLHQALADVLGVGWRRSEQGNAAGYLVERLPANRMEEAREQAEADRALGEGLRRLMAANQPEGAENQVPRNRRPLLVRPGRQAALLVLGDLTPAEQAQVLAGGSVDRAVASLSPEGQARVKKMVEELRREANQWADESLAEPGAPRLRRWEQPPDPDNGAAWRIQFTPQLGSSPSGEPLFMVRVFSPGELGIGMGWGVPIALPDRQNRAHYRLLAARPSPKETPAELPLPEQFEPRGRSWEEMARDLARTLGRSVVSDAYRPTEHVHRDLGPAVKEDSLESYLDRACRLALNRRWGRAGPALLFQRCDWATRRRAQIPESQVRRWRGHIIDTGRLSLDHLVEMAALTPYQLPNLGDVIGRQVDVVTEHQELLLFWKALPDGKQGALRGEGLVIRDLPLAVQPRARALVSGMLGSSVPLVLANAKLRVEQTEEAFTFSVLSPERPAVMRRVELTCPAWFRELLQKEEAARAAAEAAVHGVYPLFAELLHQLRRVVVVEEEGHALWGNREAVCDCSNWIASWTASGATRYQRATSSSVWPAAEEPWSTWVGTPDAGSVGWPKARAGSRTTRRLLPSGQ